MFFRVEENVPDVYINQSRDFQLLSRLYDIVLQSTRFSIDSIPYVSDTMRCNSSLLPLVATKVGLFDKLSITDDSYRKVISAFPHIIRHKGSIYGIELISTLFQNITGRTLTVEQDSKDYSKIYLSFEDSIEDIELLKVLIEYVRPVGVLVEYRVIETLSPNKEVLLISSGTEIKLLSGNLNDVQRINPDTEFKEISNVNFTKTSSHEPIRFNPIITPEKEED